jgi:predicted PolB exonuclease-like 3'-5' exonuclease
MKIYLDIETIPGVQWFQDVLRKDVQPPGNYKNPEAIDKWWATTGNEQREQAAAKASFIGTYGEVVCVCLAIGDGPVIRASHQDSEKSMLEYVFDTLQHAMQPGAGKVTWIGHNVCFDLRFLWQRMVINGLRPDLIQIPRPGELKPWSPQVFDTLHQWTGGEVRHHSLDNLARALGIEGKPDGMDGSRVWEMVKAGQLAAVVDYCANDVRIVREIHNRMT